MADRLRLSVTDLRIPSANHSISPYVTISVGICSAIPTSLETYPNMVQAADDELYLCKKTTAKIWSPSASCPLNKIRTRQHLLWSSVPPHPMNCPVSKPMGLYFCVFT